MRRREGIEGCFLGTHARDAGWRRIAFSVPGNSLKMISSGFRSAHKRRNRSLL